MNYESELSVHATQTLHKQNPVLFDLINGFCWCNQKKNNQEQKTKPSNRTERYSLK
jgi:hypothetical protein